ncbi:nicotinate-nucleotide--dimethylbenzimidazole phosphoribosyltransferase [Alkalilimnicola sp. S0819]|uniref:nicotinate-nucleotide--dimethylbenzimidazole phosphoribosyltransferase n=1 Tax=Alkalilimnicola sp. S0819 TaxID=2613922 RepID=UPI001261615D|nr:nicotinate-nucleotide--dimethylbenzimidazole phosphoribosyltransferase [Alkalilimnicola sp. S0819]KAB7623369.1 nicotinate-nucleotide--dimethylbenzimidazole phosphoribosyltransferase [Alkalilimnicola sp. S0819]MPQ16909.1 nicotinate-nucleotide--dimethylbenzimidazole phosphoribosyltransferase [Alkalilimnicola sp. S0819]
MNHRDLGWLNQPIPRPDNVQAERARQRQANLTKPPGSLGRLEQLAINFCAWQGVDRPWLGRLRTVIFAADHGVVAEGVSAFPQSVTGEMIRNFARGGAAVSVLARDTGAELEVINLGTVEPLETLDAVMDQRIAPGTRNFCQEPAMTAEQLAQALNAGHEAVQRAGDIHMLIGGEMGIGNTSAASAVAAAVLGLSAAELTGPGTGLDAAGVARKAAIIQRGLERHGVSEPLDALRCLGGFELAALVGAYLACGQARLPVLVDGFISSVAALVAVRLRPELRDWLIFSHRSAEPGHARVLEELAAEPLLDLGMCLGEASGAMVAVPLLRTACSLHDNMATFDEAGISGGG